MWVRSQACPCGKVAVSSYKGASRILRGVNARNREPLNSGDVYWCPEAGGFHLTSMEGGDYDRAQARRCQQPGDNAGDNPPPADDRTISLDPPGAATATRPAPAVETLAVCATA